MDQENIGMSKLFVSAISLSLLCAALTFAAEKKPICPKGAEPGGSWTHGIQVGDTLYVSGMGGEDAAGKIPGEFEAEVKQALDNVEAVLKEAGMSTDDVVSVQLYLTDVKLFDRMNAVYRTHFKEPRPTRTTVVVAALVGP